MNIVILYGFAYLNECVEFGCVYGCTAYYVNLLCRSVILVLLIILFFAIF
jgi:hypothetical protein